MRSFRKKVCTPLRTNRSYSTTTCRTVSLQNGIGGSPAPICLDYELVMGSHHSQKPIVGFAGRVDAIVR